MCDQGNCVCIDGDWCDGSCIDLKYDYGNCGACGSWCGNDLLPMMHIPIKSFDAHPYNVIRGVA
jgi:hypothetical protein